MLIGFDISMHHTLNVPAVQLISNSNRPLMLPAHWDGNVEYSRLWYYPGCLKYWLRVLKPTAVIGMHVGITVSTWLIYRAFWCNSVGGKVNKTWFKDTFRLTAVLWQKVQIVVLKTRFVWWNVFYSLLKLVHQSKKKRTWGWEARGVQVVLNFSGAAGDN